MNPILKNILAVVAGLIVGSAINMGLIILGHQIIPLPEGTDTSTMEGLKAAMASFGPKDFLFPFLAHAVGTLAGAYVAARIAATSKMRLALVIGFAFLIGGVINVVSIPAPIWFEALDLIAAYLPMAWLGGRMAIRSSKATA
jgi:hypothetical protein